jgi:hypothetical protein
MKLTATLLLIAAAIIGFILPSNTERAYLSPFDSNDFILGAMNDYVDPGYGHTANPDEFGMNLWHRYTGSERDPSSENRYYPTGWTSEDKLFAPAGTYEQGVMDKITENANHNMRTLLHRPKVEWLCFGQRSDYQCEDEQNVDPYYWFYSFQRHNTGHDYHDFTQYGSGQWVRQCRADIDQADTVVARLKANNEQCNKSRTEGFDHWDDSRCLWLIKPSIRIDKDYANDPANYSTLVCRIDVYNVNGYIESNPEANKIKSIDVRVRNFKDDQLTPYDGNYREEYTFIEPNQYWIDTSSQDIQGVVWNPYDSSTIARGRVYDDTPWSMCKADIRVYWYGYCDMWIDYLRMDNDVADTLFKGEHDDWLQLESDIANSSPSSYKFYIEEFEFNNIPCIAYVNQKLKQYTDPDVDMMVCFYWRGIFSHMNWFGYIRTGMWTNTRKFDAEILHHVLMQPAGITTLFTETYPFQANDLRNPLPQRSKIPSTLNVTPGPCILASTTGPSDYDDWLQFQLDNPNYPVQPDSFVFDAGWQGWTLKLANDYARTYGTSFVNMPQTHLWGYWDVEVRREPTNSELKLQTNLALSYGAKGLIYFWYGGFNNCDNPIIFGKGFLDDDQYSIVPRIWNAYGEAKWDSLIAIHKQIRVWGPTFMSFNNTQTNSYTYYKEDERDALIEDSYFRWFMTGRPGTIQENCPDLDNPPSEPIPPTEQGIVYDCKEYTYLQVATFENTNETNTNYFMIVNRRCAPFIDDQSDYNNGGRRKVKVLFHTNPPQLEGANNWTITEIGNDDWALIIDKTANQYIDFGWFQPGEGRLYKMEPTVRIGGVFAGNEDIKSGQNFTCDGSVWTNGYNFDIENNVTIHFTNSGKFIVQGGTFTMGNSQQSGQDIVINAADGSSWKGFELDICNVNIYNTSFLGFDNEDNCMLTMIDCPIIDIRNCVFDTESGTDKGVLDIEYSGMIEPSVNDNIYVGNNSFSTGDAELPAVKVMAYSGFSTPVIIESNDFTGLSSAVFLNNVQGGAVKSNTFTGYGRSVTALSSSADVFGNTITSYSGTYGLEALTGTELRMSYSGGMLLGGRNTITNSGASSYNVYLED